VPTTPTYDLDTIQARERSGSYFIRSTAASDARGIGFGEVDIVRCIAALDATCFHKTMPAHEPRARAAGLWQDVYRARVDEHWLYIKLQISASGAAVIISFKRRSP
jgi:hypothetical protein